MNSKYIIISVIILSIAGIGIYLLKDNSSENQKEVVNPMTTNSGENAPPGSTVHDLPVEPAAAAARANLAAKLSVSEKSIVIMQITEKTWSDGCLGLGGANESCLLALVPGFLVEMQASGETYKYRTNKTGESLRQEI